MDDDGFVCEATGENIFGERWQVTAVDHRMHSRESPGRLSRNWREPRGKVRLEELSKDEALVTGTSAEVDLRCPGLTSGSTVRVR